MPCVNAIASNPANIVAEMNPSAHNNPQITSTTRPLVPPSANRLALSGVHGTLTNHSERCATRYGTIFPPTRHQTRSQRHRVLRLLHCGRRMTPSAGLHGASSLRWMPCRQEKQGHECRGVLYIYNCLLLTYWSGQPRCDHHMPPPGTTPPQ